MYLGTVSRSRRATSSTREPKHPYTGALLSAVPIPNPELGRARKQIVLEGDVPSPINPPSACRFHPRCPRFHEGHCDVEPPPLYPFGDGHVASCHYPLERWPLTEDEIRHTAGAAACGEPVLGEPGRGGSPLRDRCPAASSRSTVLGVAPARPAARRPARTARSRSASTWSAASCSISRLLHRQPRARAAQGRGARAHVRAALRPLGDARRARGSAQRLGDLRRLGFALILLGAAVDDRHRLF